MMTKTMVMVMTMLMVDAKPESRYENEYPSNGVAEDYPLYGKKIVFQIINIAESFRCMGESVWYYCSVERL